MILYVMFVSFLSGCIHSEILLCRPCHARNMQLVAISSPQSTGFRFHTISRWVYDGAHWHSERTLLRAPQFSLLNIVLPWTKHNICNLQLCYITLLKGVSSHVADRLGLLVIPYSSIGYNIYKSKSDCM